MDGKSSRALVAAQGTHITASDTEKPMSSARQFWRWLSILCGRRSVRKLPADQPQPPPILCLPPELIIYINSFLETPDSLAFEMTCASIFICVPRKRRVLQKDIDNFLLRYEREPLNLFFCHGCHKLHRWSQQWRTFPDFTTKSLSSRSRTDVPACALEERFQTEWRAILPYHLAHLAMNRHLLGPEYGIPLENLDTMHSRMSRPAKDLQISQETRHKIIQGKLLQKSTLTITYREKENFDPLKRFLEEEPLLFCRHFDSKTNSHWTFPVFFKRLHKGPPYSVPPHRDHDSCLYCYTDWCMDFFYPETGWTFVMSTYRLFSAGSPFDKAWKVMQGKVIDGRGFSDSLYSNDDIRRMWKVQQFEEAGGA